ncbi:MAG: ATP-binding protein [Desulfotignum sp.]|jgi:PAS domain S-box-containing protein|nr:ATP-binding protein [Desulfotignum sp.]
MADIPTRQALMQRINDLEKETAQLQDTKQNLQQNLRDMIFLKSLGDQLSRRLSVDNVARSAVDGICDLMPADLVIFFLREQDQLHLVSQKYTDHRFRHRHEDTHKVGHCLCGLAVKEKHPVYAVNIHTDVRCTWNECKKSGLTAFAALPLCIDDAVIGILGLASACEYDFQNHAILLETAANQIAVGLQNALYYNRIQEHAQEMVLEIQEKKRVKQVLDDSINFTEAVLDSIPDVIGVQDKNHRIIRYNTAGYAFLGRTPENAIGRKCFELIGRVSPCRTCATAEVYKTKKPAQVQKYVTDMDKWLDVRAYPILDENNQIAQVIEHLRDISREKQAEIQLRESHERLIAVLNSIDATIYVADMETHEIIFMNRHMIESFGKDSIGDICWKAFRNASGPCPHCTNDKLIDENNNPTGVCVWQDHNPVTGKFYVNHDRAIKWTDGRIVKLQVATDITDHKKMEEQLRQAQKMEAVGTLAGGVAHDFNNMLGVISGHAELALKKADPEDNLYRDLMQIHSAANRSAGITRQLLAFARKQTISPKVLDLNDTVKKMLKMLGRLIGEDIDLLWEPAEDVCTVNMDPSQIDQILANLCVNARDAIAGVGRITIETGNIRFDQTYCDTHAGFVPGEFVLLAVSDNGCGMDQITQKNLFEPFYTTKKPGKGTGLGLATVYGIVKQNSGFINVYSETGMGSTFRIYLPRHTGVPGRITEESVSPMPLGKKETILIVEDEATILEMLESMLESLGYTPLSADTPGRAIQIAREHTAPIHLLMTDVVMPEMNGRHLAEKMADICPQLKIVFMSGYTANVIAHQGVLHEDVHFLQKPFSMEDLAKKIRKVLDE